MLVTLGLHVYVGVKRVERQTVTVSEQACGGKVWCMWRIHMKISAVDPTLKLSTNKLLRD